MKILTKKFLLIFFISHFFLLSGCSYKTELNKLIIIQGICVDKLEDKFLLTLSLFDAEMSSQKDEESEKQSEDSASIVKCRGESLLDAFSSLSNLTGKKPLFSDNLILVIGEECAKEGVYSFIDFFIRHYEARPSIQVFVSKGEAGKIFDCKIDKKKVNAKLIESLSKSCENNLGVVSSNLVDFISNIYDKSSGACAIVLEKNEDDLLMAKGTALFLEDKLVDFIDSNDSLGVLLLSRKIKNGNITINIDGVGKVTYSIISKKHKISVSPKKDNSIFNIKVSIDANIYEIDRDLTKKLTPETKLIMEENLNTHLKKICDHAIETCLKNTKCDVFEFGRYLLKSDPLYFREIEDSFKEKISQFKYNIEVKTSIKKTGQEVGSYKI